MRKILLLIFTLGLLASCVEQRTCPQAYPRSTINKANKKRNQCNKYD